MPMLSPAPSLTLSPASTTSDNPNHCPFSYSLLSSPTSDIISLVMPLVLLRHRIETAGVVLRGTLQQGHRARVVARATIRCRRIVAIEFATCRSGRTGSASGFAILGTAKRRKLIGGVAGS